MYGDQERQKRYEQEIAKFETNILRKSQESTGKYQ